MDGMCDEFYMQTGGWLSKWAAKVWLHLSNLTNLGFEAVMAGVVQMMVVAFWHHIMSSSAGVKTY